MSRLIVPLLLVTRLAFADGKPPATCELVPDHTKLRATLQAIVKQGKEQNSGFGNQEWAAVVNRDGVVCAVAFSGQERDDQWPGSRLIAVEKAGTTNALSTSQYALSTANLFAAAQPGQSLYSLATAFPPNPQAVFGGGTPPQFGQPDDPFVGRSVGGIIVFGGGLALYKDGKIVGGLGVSGDTSCADHTVAWKMRHALALDAVPAGPAPGNTDNMILDMPNGVSASGFGHPTCKGGQAPDAIIAKLAIPPLRKRP